MAITKRKRAQPRVNLLAFRAFRAELNFGKVDRMNMTIQQRLAAALREAISATDKQAELLKAGVQGIPCPRDEARDAWRDALAAYDAQQAATPSDGAWRAEDYAVSNGESGVCIKEGDDTVVDLPFMPAWPEPTQRARAARIVQCVNAYDALVSALRNIADAEPATPNQFGEAWNAAHAKLCGYARAAIAQARATP